MRRAIDTTERSPSAGVPDRILEQNAGNVLRKILIQFTRVDLQLPPAAAKQASHSADTVRPVGYL